MTDTATASRRIAALFAKAQSTTHPAERDTLLDKVRDLCAKYNVPMPTVEAPASRPPTAEEAKMKYRRTNDWFRPRTPTAEEAKMKYRRAGVHIDGDDTHSECTCSKCKAAAGSAYRDDFFSSAFRDNAGTSGSRDYSNDAPRARRNGSHANCDHEATKSARAKCRRERGF